MPYHMATLDSFRLGRRLVVVASSPAAAKQIHKTNNLIFTGRYFPSVYYNVPGATHASFVMAGECDDNWKFLRCIGQNCIFSSKAIESAAGIRKAKVMEMVGFLQTGKIVNIERVTYTTLINSFTNILVSRKLCDTEGEGETDEKVTGFLNELIKKANIPGLADMFPILKGIDVWSKWKCIGISNLFGEISSMREEIPPSMMQTLIQNRIFSTF